MRLEYSEDFDRFWKIYPLTPNMSKKEAWTQWNKIPMIERHKISAGAVRYAEWLREQRMRRADYPAVHACRFISQRRFDGFQPQSEVPKAGNMTYAPANSRQLEEWDRYMKTTRGRGLPRDSKGGWWVSSEWPPQMEGVG